LVLALALLVLHDAAFTFEHGIRDVTGEKAHAVGLEVQRSLESRHGHCLEEVRAVDTRRAVSVGGAEVVHRLAESVGMVLAAVEEEVLEEVCEAGATRTLVARPHVIPDVDG